MIEPSRERLILRDAAKIVRLRWGQGVSSYGHDDEDRPLCIMGAIDRATTGQSVGIFESGTVRDRCIEAVRTRIKERWPDAPVYAGNPVSDYKRAINIAAWNDQPERTSSEVSDILDLASGDV